MKNSNLLYLLILCFLFSCEKKEIPVDSSVTTVVNSNGDTIVDPVKGTLLFHENFQNWNRTGYYLTEKNDCETDLMTSVNVVSYMPTRIKVLYDSLTVTYSIIDFAVNPVCGNSEGTSTATSDVSLGYVALQCPLWYNCYCESNGYFQISSISEVSYVEFSISHGDNSGNNYAAGVSLWCKSDNNTDTVKIGTYVPSNPLIGERFTVKINAKNASLRFKAEKNSDLKLATEKDDPIVNRSIRIHDLYIWK